MSGAGWYPDPGQQPGMYRYWTGTEWTSALTPNPSATPAPNGNASGNNSSTPEAAPRKKAKVGWWVAGVSALVVLGLVIFAIARGLPGLIAGGNPGVPGGNPSQNVCPKTSQPRASQPTAPPQKNDGRVHGGRISYPTLGLPWGDVEGDNRVPFATDVASQVVVVEPSYDGNSTWVASVLVAKLVAGDGFFAPKDGANIVMRCVVGAFYSDAVVDRKDQVSKQITVDGHDAWILESHLGFDIPGLKTKGELAIVVVVDNGDKETASLYYASIPDTVPELVPVARDLVNKLKIDA